MIRVIKNDSVTSQVDMQRGRDGLIRRIDDIHVYREGTAMSRWVVLAFRENGHRTTISMSAARATELIAALQAIHPPEAS